jgi:hypothetical protein
MSSAVQSSMPPELPLCVSLAGRHDTLVRKHAAGDIA